jgi:hypothetical protein
LIFFVRETGGVIPVDESLRFRRTGSDDALTYARDIGTDSPGTFKRRLSDATRCFVVEAEGLLLHASWVTTLAAWTRELNSYVKPPTGDAYIYESFTRADARGRGVYPFALNCICATLGSEGISRAWVAAEEDNPASAKAITKAGFTEAFRVSYERRFGRLHIGEFSGEMADMGRTFLHRHP